MPKYRHLAVLVTLVLGPQATSEAQVFNAPTKTNSTVQQAGGPAAAAPVGEVQQTGWSGVPLPKITMPKITMPKITMPNMSSVTTPIKSGFGKVTAGSKKAWEGAKEMLSFGKQPTTSTTVNRAATQKKPSVWQRLITRNPEPKVPQTVGEFMSQPRLDP